ncbi:MAG: helix-turn-helix domain-containing protein [Flavobacteriaceae bacterium]
MITDKEYVEATLKLEALLKIMDQERENEDETLNKELVLISNIIENYEETHFSMGMPNLIDVIELRMFEMKLKQKDLAVLLGTSASRISEIFKGKRDITLSLAKSLHKKLNIDSDIILQ